MKIKITEAFAKNAEIPAKGSVVYWDTDVHGFGLRVTSSGVKSFVQNYVHDGRERRATRGRYPEYSVVAARNEALDMRGEVRQGKDPIVEREAKKAEAEAATKAAEQVIEEAAKAEHTIEDLAHEYYERHVLRKNRPNSIKNNRCMVKNIIIPRIGKMKVPEFSRRDIEDLHYALRETQSRANRVLAVLGKMFNLAIDWGWRTAENPTRRVERYHEEPKTVWLNVEEMSRLMAARFASTKTKTSPMQSAYLSRQVAGLVKY